MAGSHYETRMNFIAEDMEKGILRQQDIGFLAFLRKTCFEKEAEEKQRQKLLTRLTLAGAFRTQALPHEQTLYKGRVGIGDARSYIEVHRIDGCFRLKHSLRKAVRTKTCYDFTGRIREVQCTALDFTSIPPQKLAEYPFLTVPREGTNEYWNERAITLGELGHFESFAEAYRLTKPDSFHEDVAHLVIERTQRLLRTLADMLWNETPFPQGLPESPESWFNLEELRKDYALCNRIGESARLWPSIHLESQNQGKLSYQPFLPRNTHTSGWARYIEKR